MSRTRYSKSEDKILTSRWGKDTAQVLASISEADVSKIVAKQVEKAKAGDEASLQFVMKYVLGFGAPTTLQQINVITTDVATAAKIANRNR